MVLTDDSNNVDSIDIEQTDFWKAMQENRIGNLLEGARLKADFHRKSLHKRWVFVKI